MCLCKSGAGCGRQQLLEGYSSHSIKRVFWRWCEDKEDEMLELAMQNGSHPPHPQLVAIKLVDVLC